MKTYSNRSNCARAAKVALGSAAVPGTHFTVAQQPDNQWAWTSTGTPVPEGSAPLAKAKAEPKPRKPRAAKAERKPRKRAEGAPRDVRTQPQAIALMKLMARERGCTIEQAMAGLGGVVNHTVRGLISLLRASGAKITDERKGRTKVYFTKLAAA